MKESNRFSPPDDATFSQTDLSTLRDMTGWQPDLSLPREERVAAALAKVGNPCHFICHGIPVRILYDPSGPTLDEALRAWQDMPEGK